MSSPVANPYPGLRPFKPGEEDLFFGRESQVDAMVGNLAKTHFLAIVGTSGSGKSSLVTCGLVPALHRGQLGGGRLQWRVAYLRPGYAPLRALAEALSDPRLLGAPDAQKAGFSASDLLEAELRLSRVGLVQAVEQARLGPDCALLIVVDQFEELFRYRSLAEEGGAAAEDADAFVNLLLEAGTPAAASIFVVITMRSDFLGDCAQFVGLPERINRGQYLVPRMSRDERRAAIEGPAGMRGVDVDPALLAQLVNDVGDNPDQLSVLQHALHRTWVVWGKEGERGPLLPRHYESAGTMTSALNLAAEEAYESLGSERLRDVCERMFKAITDQTVDPRGTRRPTRLDRLCAIVPATSGELNTVIDVFREPTRSFIMPPAGVTLLPESAIDISHESLMRIWKRLREWAIAEALSVQTFRRLVELAELNEKGEADLLPAVDLHYALEWRRRARPNPDWAARYRPGGMEIVDAFLEASSARVAAKEAEERRRAEEVARGQQREQKLKRRMRTLTAVVVILGLGLGLGLGLMRLSARNAALALEAATATAKKTDAEQGEKQAKRELGSTQAELQQALEVMAADNAVASGDLLQQLQAPAPERPDSGKVTIQVASRAQMPYAERLRAALHNAGFEVDEPPRIAEPSGSSEIRHYREEERGDADALAALLKTWRCGTFEVRLLPRPWHARPKGLEIVVGADDPGQMRALLVGLNAKEVNQRKAAAVGLYKTYTGSASAIDAALDMLQSAEHGRLSNAGRANLLFFLTRTSPLTWTPPLVQQARAYVAATKATEPPGPVVSNELARLEHLLVTVEHGAPSAPGTNGPISAEPMK